MNSNTDIERKWQKYWAENGTYAADENPGKPGFYVLDMFPYPSGSGLHVGHPLGYIASDIYARFKRHEGFNVLHPMGYDSFGLPAEQYAIQTGQHPAVTTEQNIARYRKQLDQLGFSFDWKRELRTSDPEFYRWTQWIFIQLFDSWYDTKIDKARPVSDLTAHFDLQGTLGLSAYCGRELSFSADEWKQMDVVQQSEILLNYRLAYRSESMVNWCPALGTVLANDEVKDGVSERGGFPVIQKKMMQWSMRISAYAQRLLDGLETIDWSDSLKETQRNWIGRSEGASVHFAVKGSDRKLEVFTTRPDTLFGVSFMVLAPEHELVGGLTTAGQRREVETYVEQAARKSERERMSDTKTVSGAFTGSYAIHPVSGREIPIWIGDYVLAGYGTGAVMAVPGHDARDHTFARHFDLPIIQVISGGDVQQEAVSAKDGQLMNSDFLDGLPVAEATKRIISHLEERGLGKGRVQYRLRDAIFGRQRYWGEPIPVYYEDGIPKTLSEEDLPLLLPEVDKYLPTEDGEPPLARAENWRTKGGHPLETTTMPGWAGSSWYFLRYMDPGNTGVFADPEKIAYWENVDLYVGGSEHATGHLLYARFWHKFLADRGWVNTQEPFKKLVNQGMIQGVSAFVYQLLIHSSEWKVADDPMSVNLLDPSKVKIYISFDQVDPLKEHDTKGEFDRRYQDETKSIRAQIQKILKEEEKRQKELDPTLEGEFKYDRLITFAKRHVDISLVGNEDELNVEEYKAQNPDAQNGHFITVNNRFIVGREVEKMSKSKYNVVNPDAVVAQYGADVLRMYEMFLGPIEASKPWDTKGITGVSNFLRKLVRLYDGISEGKAQPEAMKALHKCIGKVREDILGFSFNTAVSAMMICVNELTDLSVKNREVLEPLAILLSPFAPHTAEELWEKLGHAPSVTRQPYPVVDESYLVESTVEYPVQFNGKTRFNINVPTDLDRKGIEEQTLADPRAAKWLEDGSVRKVIVVPGRIVNVVVG